ncbi:MAG: glycine cleavage system protein H [Planctomycetaceae bacterium]|nr:glycine cleavage system protein H [Planctomycetaceae bacterium]
MSSPGDCRYSESHEWFRLEGDMVTIGITQHAADELTDITYVEMAPAGSSIDAGGSLGEVESVKTTAEVISAVGGEVKEVNEALASDPSILNNDPYQAGWLVKITVTDSSPLDGLMDSATYDERNG